MPTKCASWFSSTSLLTQVQSLLCYNDDVLTQVYDDAGHLVTILSEPTNKRCQRRRIRSKDIHDQPGFDVLLRRLQQCHSDSILPIV